MAEADVVHRIWTHAPSGRFDSAGVRNVRLDERDAADLLPREVLADLDDLLRKTTPAGNTAGYVVRRYVAGDAWFGCLVTTHPDLVTDAEGRRGLLTHARLVRLDPSDVWLDVPALAELAESFPIAEVCATSAEDRLATYLGLVSSEARISVRSVATEDLQELSRSLLIDALEAWLASLGQKKGVVVPPATHDASIQDLGVAWCSLPKMLQRNSSWAIGVGAGCPVDVVFSTTSGTPAGVVAGEKLVALVNRYVTLLTEAPQEVHSLLRNSEITDVIRFSQMMERAAVAAPLAKIPGKDAMAKKERKGGREDLDALDPELVAELNRQFQAIEDELRIYIDQRFEDLEARQLIASRQPRSPFWKDARVWSPLVVALVAMGVFFWWGPQRMRQEPRGTRPTATQTTNTAEETAATVPAVPTETLPAETPVNRAMAKAATTQLWAEAFKDLLDRNGPAMGSFILAVAGDPEIETDATVTELRRFASKVAAQEDLRREGRDRLRALLVDAIAKRVASDDGVATKIKVDGDLRDVDAILEQVKSRVGVKSAETKAASMQLQGEIILRWMENLNR